MRYSVIIPIHNSEKTIVRCIRSLLREQREDAEILIIDDGSEDNSYSLIEHYLGRQYPAVRYIRQSQQGVSAARNRGLDAAQGEYVTFVDSDDYVSGHYFQQLDSMDEADLWVFNHVNQRKEPQNSDVLRKLKHVDDPNQSLMFLLYSRIIMQPWNKRFKRSILQRYNLKFLVGISSGEDFAFCMSYALKCRNIRVTDRCLYAVDLSDNGSLSRTYRPKLARYLKTSMDEILRNVQEAESVYDRRKILTILDYINIRHGISCIAEEWRVEKPTFSHRRIGEIFRTFGEQRIGASLKYCSLIHLILRILLACHMYYPFYWMVSRKQRSAACPRKLKVLMVAGHMNVGGLENQLMHVLRNADPASFQIDFTSFMPEAYYREEIESLGGQFILISDMDWHRPWEYMIRMYRVMKEGRYDIVHSHELFHSGITLSIARLAGVPCRIAHAHNWNDGTRPGEKRSRVRAIYNAVMQHLILKNATELIACSTLAGEFVFGTKALEENRYHLIYNSVDTGRYLANYDRIESGEFTDKEWKNVLHVGRVTQVKNQRFLIDIAECFRESGDKIRILCAGNGEEEEWNYLQNEIRSRRLEEYIYLLGVRDDIDVLMRKAAAFVLPSLYEGMPLVLIEAQAAGLPCVVADTFSHEVDFGMDQIQWLPLNESAKFWAEQLRRAVKEPRADKKAVENAISEYGFDSRIFAEKLCRIYREDYLEHSKL